MPFRSSSRFVIPVFLMILAGAAAPTRAQVDKGLTGGWNRSDWVSDGTTEEFEPLDGFCAGLYLGARLSGRWQLRGEALYTRKGARTTTNPTDDNGNPLGEVDTSYQVDYLEIPLLLSFSITTGGSVRPVLQAGGSVDFQLSAEETSRYPSGIALPFDSTQEIPTLTTTDFSLIVSGGVDIDAGTKVINLQIRYVLGLEEIYAQSRNRTFSLMAGFGI